MIADNTSGKARGSSATALISAALLAAAAGFLAVYVSLGGIRNVADPRVKTPETAADAPAAPEAAGAAGALAGLNTGKMAAFVVRSEPSPLPKIAFTKADGGTTTLAEWQGRVVLLNLWATWCAPCREEMPSLDRLKAKLGGADFDVVAVASERGDIDKPRQFLREMGVEHLALYHDATAKLPAALKAFGMPVTILIGRDGKEVGRLVGPAAWDSPEAAALIKAAIAADAI